jgi:pimeloyl-ACP methyl ester carboxylesterase
MTLGPAHLFGVLSEPEHDIAPSAPTVVFLNVGLISHHGPGRLWVELARAAAAAGHVRCLRVDLSGIGDSPTRPGRVDMRSFPIDSLQDMEDIRQAASADGAPLMVMGVCSGADHAIEMALAAPVASICVINPALSYVQWGKARSPTTGGPRDVG